MAAPTRISSASRLPARIAPAAPTTAPIPAPLTVRSRSVTRGLVRRSTVVVAQPARRDMATAEAARSFVLRWIVMGNLLGRGSTSAAPKEKQEGCQTIRPASGAGGEGAGVLDRLEGRADRVV